MNFISNPSSQVITALAGATGTYDGLITSNVMETRLATKQDTLTSNTTLLGIGSNITSLDWNKITLNKPTVFNPDLTNLYTKSQTDSLVNGKENSLTFTSPLSRTTNTISFNESSITTLTNFYNKTETLALSTLTNYYNKTK